MVKIIIYSLYILLINSILQYNPSINYSTPAHIEAGEIDTVKIRITKGDITGFARFQQKLPLGITPEPIKTENANFNLQDNTMKFIWFNLPKKNTITLAYTIRASKKLKGEFELNGSFSYIINNQRKEKNNSPQTIRIIPQPNVKQSIDINEYPNTEKQFVDIENTKQFICVRQKPYKIENENAYRVNILINKQSQVKFAKIEEQIPEGYKAAPVNKDPLFLFNNNTAKYLWMNLPSEQSFTVSYKLIPRQKKIPPPKITGKFSYVKDNKTQIIPIIQKDNINLNNANMAYLENIINDWGHINANSTNQTQKDTINKNTAVKDSTQQLNEQIKLVSGPIEGVYYRVQIAAGHKPVHINEYFDQYDLKHRVKSERHEGWIKYTIGSFYKYEQAHDYKIYLRNTTDINDAFVAAYYNGKRITVQEALMITEQEMYQ